MGQQIWKRRTPDSSQSQWEANPSSHGRRPSRPDKRVQHWEKTQSARAPRSARARGSQCRGPRRAGEGKTGKGSAGSSGPWNVRERPLVAGGEDARGGLAARPSPGEARVPAARACAARRPRERAVSVVRALAVSVTHQLRHRQQDRRRHRPPSAAATRHFILCFPLLPSPSVDYQVSARPRKVPPGPPPVPSCRLPSPPASEMGFPR